MERNAREMLIRRRRERSLAGIGSQNASAVSQATETIRRIQAALKPSHAPCTGTIAPKEEDESSRS